MATTCVSPPARMSAPRHSWDLRKSLPPFNAPVLVARASQSRKRLEKSDYDNFCVTALDYLGDLLRDSSFYFLQIQLNSPCSISFTIYKSLLPSSTLIFEKNIVNFSPYQKIYQSFTYRSTLYRVPQILQVLKKSM